MKLEKFEIEKVFQMDAAEMVAAREKAILIHHTRDIDAAGDEVEKVVRNVIKRKLPTSYYVGHGHIVDSQLNSSNELDIVIADNLSAPVLMNTANGTEYFIFESVYAIGEIKSTYYKSKNYIKDFIGVVSDLKFKNKLQRERVPTNYLGNGISLGGGLRLDRTPVWPYMNPLFSFMLFVNSGDFSIEDIQEIYKERKAIELPNIICFLDKGLIVNFRSNVEESKSINLGTIDLIPEFNDNALKNEWLLINISNSDENVIGSNFSFLYLAIINHLKSSLLKETNMLPYLSNIFQSNIVDGKFKKVA